jgi:hypothetical protein
MDNRESDKRVKASKSTKTIFNTGKFFYYIFIITFRNLMFYFILSVGDKRFGFVNWAVKISTKHPLGGFGDKYNVVPMTDFEKKDEYDLDGIYSVRFGQGKFNAKLLFIG